MKCPHCLESFHPQWEKTVCGHAGRTENFQYLWHVFRLTCPACSEPVIYLKMYHDYGSTQYEKETRMVYPKGANRPPAPSDVPKAIAEDYNEACLVLSDSPKASAALSRRCLQHILADRKASTSDNLSTAIDHALASGLPSHIASDLDAVRAVGNFAAHPQKAAATGEILPVEPEEAEWNLDVLEALFDYYYVQPALSEKKRKALNEKLEKAGKKSLKKPGDAEAKK